MLNEKIKALRKANNLTQEELADKLCVSRQAITKWESGLGIPDISNIEAIAKLFGISIDELISNDVKINKDNISRTEFDVFSENDFELDVGTVKNLDLSLIDEEKVIIELHNESDIESFKIAKVKLDDSHDINLKIVKIKLNKKIGRNYSKQDAKKYLSVKVMLPKTLAGRIELFGEPQSLNVHDITAEKHIEFDGKVTDVSVLNSQGHFELTSGIDMEIEYDGSMKQLDINQLKCVSNLYLNKEAKVDVYNKGRGCAVVFENYKNNEASEHKVELNGYKSELTVHTK